MAIERRLIIVAVVISFIGALILVRLFTIQVIWGDYYRELSRRQQGSFGIPEIERGDIIFRDKNKKEILVATTRSGFTLYADSRYIKDAEFSYARLSEILDKDGLGVDKSLFMEIALKNNDPFEILLRKIDPSLAEKIKDAGIDGVGIKSEEWRYYPLGNFSAHVVGFFGHGAVGEEGMYGVERFYEKELKGVADYFINEKGEKEKKGFVSSFAEKFFKKPAEGEDIYLTIDIGVEQELEKHLEKITSDYASRKAGGIIIEPKTGKILAMAARPDFDPNSYFKTEDISEFLNPMVSSLFELGSILKPLTMAAAIDNGSVSPDTTYEDKGYLYIEGSRIENYDAKGRGVVNMREVLKQSLNTGAVFAQKALGKDKFLEYFENYGFDEKTDIDLPNESIGDIYNLLNGGDVEYATASFGQGIAITPIQFARAASALANGGLLVRPYVVEELKGKDIDYKITEPKIQRRVISENTSEEITRMLVEVVDKALLGGGRGPKNYSVAAKTGTAQIANKYSRGYSDEYLHAFFGYAPAYDPKFLIFLFAEAPQGVRYASSSLGPAFLDLTDFLLDYYEVPPDR